MAQHADMEDPKRIKIGAKVAQRVHQQLKKWSRDQKRSMSSAVAYLIEKSVEDVELDEVSRRSPPTEVMFDAATGRFETKEEYEARVARQRRPVPPVPTVPNPVKRAFEIPADANASEVRLLTRWPDWAPHAGMTAGEALYMPRDWVNKDGLTLTEQEDTGLNDEGMRYWPPGEVPE